MAPSSRIIYPIYSRPPPLRTLILALQHVLTMFGATVAVPLLLGPQMGLSKGEIAILISSVMVCSGVATLLQTTFGYGWLKANPVAEGSWAYNPNAEYPTKQDMEKAKELMKEAGYEPGEPAFTITLKYWKERPENLQICQIAQANLAELGITVELELLEIMQWVQKVLWDYDYEAALTSLVPRWDPNDQLGNCYTTDDGAALQWENEEFLKYWQAGRATSDLEERKEAYWKAQEIAAQEAPCAILNGSPAFAAATSNVRGAVRYNRGKLWYDRIWLAP